MKREERYEPVYEALIVRRNERMAEQVKGLLKEDRTVFVVVGSAHVIGEEGIVARLERAGHEVDEL